MHLIVIFISSSTCASSARLQLKRSRSNVPTPSQTQIKRKAPHCTSPVLISVVCSFPLQRDFSSRQHFKNHRDRCTMDSNANADVESMIAPQRVAIGILGSSCFVPTPNIKAKSYCLAGPCLVAWCSQLFLSGICLSSFYHYARQGHFSRDTARIKLFVTTVVGLNVIMGFCSGVDIFRWGTTQERTSVQLWSQTIMDCLMPTMGSIAAFLVQGWFLRRTTLVSCFLDST